MFNQLYRLDSAVEVVTDDSSVYAAAAVSEKEAAVMFTHYSDDEKPSVEVTVDLSGFGAEAGSEIEYFLLDKITTPLLWDRRSITENVLHRPFKCRICPRILSKLRRKKHDWAVCQILENMG